MEHYVGELRDKLLALHFVRFTRSTPSAGIIDSALQTVHNSIYEPVIHKRTRTLPGQMIHGLSFKDKNDKSIELDNIESKVLVVDFWYTGCVACARLKIVMEPVMKFFKNDKNVVFITVSIDNKVQWLESLKKGTYTHTSGLNLYTGGLEDKHPFMEYYNIIGYPKQIIVVNGKVFDFSPPVPILNGDNGINGNRTIEKLVETIETAIKETGKRL